MRSRTDAETHEDLDDPIKIIDVDSDQNSFIDPHHRLINAEIVDFGCVLDSEDIVDQYTRAEKSPRSPTLSLVTISDDFNSDKQSTCQSARVKLVDCNKFPWYYKKYTTHIVKIMINNSIAAFNDASIEDDDIIDVDLEEDITATNKITSHELRTEVEWSEQVPDISNTTLRDRIIKLKEREDLELQAAIEQRNKTKIDLKKNQGLVGLRISHRKITNDVVVDKDNNVKECYTPGGKQPEVQSRGTYVEAVNKMSGKIGTSVTSVSDLKDKSVDLNKGANVCFQSNIDVDKTTRNSDTSLKCSLKVASPKILENIRKLKEAKKNIEMSAGNQSTFLKYDVAKNSYLENVEKDTKFGNNSEVSKVVLKTKESLEYENAKNKANAKPIIETKMVVQKAMPKCKKTKIVDNITTEMRGYSSAGDKINKTMKPNESATLVSSEPKNHFLNESIIKSKPNAENIHTQDTPNKSIARVKSYIENLAIEDLKQSNDKILSNIPKAASNSLTCTMMIYDDTCDVNLKTLSHNQPVPQRKVTDKAFDENKILNGALTNNQAPDCIKINTALPYSNKPNVVKKPRKQRTLKNVNRKPRILQTLSFDKLGKFYDCVRSTNNDFVVGDKVLDSSLLQPDLPKPTTSVAPQHEKLNDNFSIRNISDIERNFNTALNKPEVSTPKNYTKRNSLLSALILRPNQTFQAGDNFIGVPIQTHVSSQPQLQKIVSTYPQQMFPNTPGPIRHQLPLHQVPPFHPSLYHQPYFMVPPIRGGPQDILLNGMYSDVNLNPYWGYPPPPVPPPPPPKPPQVNLQNPPRMQDSSVIGENTDGVIKKINISAISFKEDSKYAHVDGKNTVKSGAPNTRYQDCEPVTSRIAMLEELDRLMHEDSPGRNLKRPYCSGWELHPEENTIQKPIRQKAGPLSKKFKLKTPTSDPRNSTKSRKQMLTSKEYSPPILPIPTFQKILASVKKPQKFRPISDISSYRYAKITGGPIKTTDISDQHAKKMKHLEEKCNRIKEDLKKISLEEYKERVGKNLDKQGANKEKQNRHNFRMQCKKESKYLPGAGSLHVDKDLGYDSDTTVKL